jgi:hypothetical protein
LGKKSSKTKSTSTPWAPAQPLLLGAGQGITDTVNNNAGNLNNLESGLTGALPGIQNQIGDTKQQLSGGINYANDVLGGKYLNSNPYMDSIVHQGEQDAGNAINSTFSLAGRTGGGNHATELARGVAQAGNQLRYGDYQNERNNMTNAAGMLPNLTSAQYAGYTPLFAGTQLAGQLPYYGAQGAWEHRRSLRRLRHADGNEPERRMAQRPAQRRGVARLGRDHGFGSQAQDQHHTRSPRP